MTEDMWLGKQDEDLEEGEVADSYDNRNKDPKGTPV